MRSLVWIAYLTAVVGLVVNDARGDEKANEGAANAATTIWAGNHWEQQGAIWTWEDSPNDLGGRMRKWEYTGQSGDGHGIIPNLQSSAGYPIHWMKIHGTPHQIHADK